MTPAQRLRTRRLCQAKKRQQRSRVKRAQQDLIPLQVRLSKLAHAKALIVSQLQGISLTDLYQLAINNTSPDSAPQPHLEPIDGDLVGSCRISPWIRKEAHNHFYESLLPKYKKSRIAISAIVYSYCESVLLDSE
ncbi:hypothetical protein P3551_23035 [Vibrio parahaemolyticus]|uniref:hypothetical protein n=1 Tax=Vibrio parahaemolyticus TaxID=670 RepID=UPI0011200D49|nr:hypothetical protein [Vibrio parahaemolyticus]MBE3985603.1 hypothetical protein [Vibrio parahaemolyticus]MBE4286379.1 hypothetical protein [Vibrio parahaemolyticus]MDF4902161.1 hypothetical protein [Vibrio parahaemolyticus]TOH19136.1 hypothetical protein CGI90_03925 [Vibrio parahaemolyticus]HCG7330420.1 hypothetical protein [Vibrio parahaemolyticus]